tara:strand:+ start:276 stop:554 length:279 start_codon:yes stop_codon:yes gene_type:complete
MCDCDKINILSLPSYLKIYTDMAKYKINKDYEGLRSSVSNFGTISWSDATQEILAHLYEDRNFTSIIIKTKSNEESNIKKSNKKSESIKKDS